MRKVFAKISRNDLQFYVKLGILKGRNFIHNKKKKKQIVTKKGKKLMKKEQTSVGEIPQPKRQSMQMEKKRTRWSILLSAALLLLLLLVASILMIPVGKLLLQEGGKEQIIEKIQSFGIFAPLLFVLLQVVQIVIAFLPGGPVPMIGGAVFGTVPGILLSLAGSFLGTALVYYLVQWIGRPLLELFVKEEHLKRFSFLQNRRKMERIVFLLFLCPGLPKDALTYIVAFNKTIPPLPLFFLTTIARLPAMALTVKMGNSLWTGNWKMVVLVAGVMVVIAGTGVLIQRHQKKKQ